MVNIQKLIEEEVKPVLGCTEPASIALAVSHAFNVFPNINPFEIDKIILTIDQNVYKNSFAVAIPNTQGQIGTKIAASIGLFCNPSYGLNLLNSISLPINDLIKSINKIKNKVEIKVKYASEIYIKAEIKRKNDIGTCIIRGTHSNVVLTKYNEKIIYKKEYNNIHKFSNDMIELSKLDINGILMLIKKISTNEKNIIRNAINVNNNASKYELENIFKLTSNISNDSLLNDIQRKVWIACAARMAGENVQVYSVAGSGNQGIASTLPIVCVGEKYKIKEDKVIESVILSILLTCYVTYYTGYLTPICGCIVKSGIGSTAGITYLLGGDVSKIDSAIKNFVGSVVGAFCDGAKVRCAMKLVSSATISYISSMLALNNIHIPGNGIVGKTFKNTIKNIGIISASMKPVEKEFIKILAKSNQ